MKQVILFSFLTMSIATTCPLLAIQATEGELFTAILKGDLPAVEAAVSHGAVVRVKPGPRAWKNSPLNIAYTNSPRASKFDIMEFLLKNGADPEHLQHYLVEETRPGNIEMIAWLVQHGIHDDGEALEYAQTLEKFWHGDPSFKKNLQEIIKLLEKTKLY